MPHDNADLPQIAGYQVIDTLSDHHAYDRPSFEILPLETALRELADIRKATPVQSGRWNMIVILEGDIEDPTFV